MPEEVYWNRFFVPFSSSKLEIDISFFDKTDEIKSSTSENVTEINETLESEFTFNGNSDNQSLLNRQNSRCLRSISLKSKSHEEETHFA